MYSVLFYIITGILLFDFVLERIMDHLNNKQWTADLPETLKGIYDPEKYRTSQEYYRENLKFGILTSGFSLVLILLMLFLGGFALVNTWAGQLSTNTILLALFFFGILGLAMDVLNTPFSLYNTFVIEEKYGFNKSTLKLFFTDKIKGWILGAVIGGGILAMVVWFYIITGKWFWLLAWAVIAGFMIFMTMFYSTLIVPLFNKQTPLEDGELKTRIRAFCNKVHFALDNVYVIDGSKRSSKANAYFSGLGRKKRIVLYDTLIEDLNPDEIVAVLAHEIGHYKMKHTRSGILLSILQMGLTLYILSWFIKNPALSMALGVEEPAFHVSLVAFGILYSPISTILGLIMNAWSRKNEFSADAFAKEHFSGSHLAAGLKKLAVKNLSNLRPHPLYVFFHYSHPPLLKRLEHLEQ